MMGILCIGQTGTLCIGQTGRSCKCCDVIFKDPLNSDDGKSLPWAPVMVCIRSPFNIVSRSVLIIFVGDRFDEVVMRSGII
jgi:hypothetical protein